MYNTIKDNLVKNNFRYKLLNLKNAIRWSFIFKSQKIKDKFDCFIIKVAWKVFKIDLYDIEDRRSFMASPIGDDFVTIFDTKNDRLKL